MISLFCLHGIAMSQEKTQEQLDREACIVFQKSGDGDHRL